MVQTAKSIDTEEKLVAATKKITALYDGKIPLILHLNYPADTRRNYNVIMTLKRRHDVVLTS